MMQYCRYTGKRYHKFDATTHQCQCGRWERGFAPAKGFVKPRAECQICERQQALDASGKLGHHGYRRPGWGFIEGDCMGQGYLPYPATDALYHYLALLHDAITGWEGQLVDMPNRTFFEYRYKSGHGARYNDKTKTINRGDQGGYVFEENHHFPGFDAMVTAEENRLKREITSGRREVKRVEARIQSAMKVSATPE